MASLEVIEETEALLQGIDTGKPNYATQTLPNQTIKPNSTNGYKKNTKKAPHRSF